MSIIPCDSLRSQFLQRRMDRAARRMHAEMLAEAHRPELVAAYNAHPEIVDALLARAEVNRRWGAVVENL